MFRFDFSGTLTHLGLTFLLGKVFGFDVSSDGRVVIGGGRSFVVAHNTATSAVLWRKDMSARVDTLRIHGGVVIVPVDNSNTVVLDVTTGHQLYALPSAGEYVYGVLCI
jgi:outer membrane protein assembly factor BamB